MSAAGDGPVGARTARTRRLAVIAAIAAFAAVAVAGCGESSKGGKQSVQASNAPKISTSDLPKALARNIRQANLIIDAPGDQLQKKLDALRGYPIVINQWASWCTPCREEVPLLQASARRHASEIAFLGLNARDNKQDARKFLEELPMLYPSVFDPDAAYARRLGGGRTFPTTVLVNEEGDVVFVQQGMYPSLDLLEAQIERYLPRKSKSKTQ